MRQGFGWGAENPHPGWPPCHAALPPGSTPEWNGVHFPPAASKVLRAGSPRLQLLYMPRILQMAVTYLLSGEMQMFPQQVQREAVRMAGVHGGDQWTSPSPEAGSSLCCVVGACRVAALLGDRFGGLGWGGGAALGWVAAVSWGTVSD